MKRRRLFLVLGTVGLAVVCLFPKSEHTFEFDAVNLRLRDCSRYCSWLFGFVLSEHCSPPEEHPAAARLRVLGVLPPIREEDSQWLLIKGFTSGMRGWKGAGSYFVRALGATSFGTPVTLPAAEDLAENVWVKWSVKDPAASKHFWHEVRALAVNGQKDGWKAAYFLLAAREYLENRKLEVVGAEVEAHARQASEG